MSNLYTTQETSILPLRMLLATCPQGHPPTAPHPALAYLQAYTKENLPQISIDLQDFNTDVYRFLFDKSNLSHFPTRFAKQIERAYTAQQNAHFYQDIPKFIEYHQTLEQALEQLSYFHQDQWGLEKEGLYLRGNTFTYICEQGQDTIQKVLTSLQEPQKNLFFNYFTSQVIPYIQKEDFDVIGLSVYLPDQILPTLLLSKLIKEFDPQKKVILGGNYLTRIKQTLAKNTPENKSLLKNIDAVVVHEGELPLITLLERITNNEHFLEIPQVIAKDKQGNIVYDKQLNPSLEMNSSPRPDFTGFFTGLNEKKIHWTPEPVITLYTQRGCPWANVCDFCTIPWGNNSPTGSKERSVERVVQDIAFYQEQFNTTVFSFANETLSTSFMQELSRELGKRNLKATLDGYTRTDQFIKKGKINKQLIQDISPYFRFLQLGIESADDDTLQGMNKKRTSATDGQLVKELFEASIYPHAFFIVGFPPNAQQIEPSREAYMNFYLQAAMKTLAWLEENKDFIGTYKATPLYIPRDDPKMVDLSSSPPTISQEYAHELSLISLQDLSANISFDKIHGSQELDRHLVSLFDTLPTPYQGYTRNTIYHQRLFNWSEGIRWSQEGASQKDLQRIFSSRCRKRIYKKSTRARKKRWGE